MRKLSEVPFEELEIGDRLISAKYNLGTIIGFNLIKDDPRREDNMIGIVWDNGKTSCQYHFWCDHVIYLEKVLI